jgi:hypothetical protein
MCGSRAPLGFDTRRRRRAAGHAGRAEARHDQGEGGHTCHVHVALRHHQEAVRGDNERH